TPLSHPACSTSSLLVRRPSTTRHKRAETAIPIQRAARCEPILTTEFRLVYETTSSVRKHCVRSRHFIKFGHKVRSANGQVARSMQSSLPKLSHVSFALVRSGHRWLCIG